MRGRTKSETPSSTNPARHVSRLVRAVLSQVWASKSVQLVDGSRVLLSNRMLELLEIGHVFWDEELVVIVIVPQ
ncbi:hypothetical protein TIFTF001_010172 [Ficus carica]|uniref:Uncharacterized protein n=1 Tax=Ficus carica TaxID=3494 RepID=A0AA88AIH9_FICCA|nr:hypothetical protein TIFTF001_010172 [Ficus carica]